MARPRVIDPDRILDAAETVVMRDGASHLTLEAVAAEAGVSKASVIYDYKTKHALIKAIIERKVAKEDNKIRAAIAALADSPNAEIRGRISTAASTMAEENQAVSLNLCSALAQDQELHSLLQESYGRAIATILQTSENPRRALLAFLALEGLKSLQMLGIHSWSDTEIQQILQEIEQIATPA